MIALKEGLPLVQLDGGQVVDFQRDWLVRSLAKAAHKAGYPNWWLAEHVAESVTSYLLLRFEGNVLGIPRLEKTVRSVLQVIGYAEVAIHFVPGAPPVKVSLAELARDAGSGYELAFFELLGRRIHELMATGIGQVEFFGLQRCVKTLRAKKTWSRDCDALRNEIVAFAREQIDSASPRRDLLLSVS